MMKSAQKGFTLIELMIVVAIIGILAAIAIPAYSDYTVRAKVSELVTSASACKASVSEYYQAQDTFPGDNETAGCNDGGSQYVASLVVGTDGVITVTAQNIAKLAGANTYVMTPTAVAGSGAVNWTCTASTIQAKYLPANCRGS